MIGNVFGHVTVIDLIEDTNNPNLPIAKIECDCGVVLQVLSYKLKMGMVKSCGCRPVKEYVKKNIHEESVVRRCLRCNEMFSSDRNMRTCNLCKSRHAADYSIYSDF